MEDNLSDARLIREILQETRKISTDLTHTERLGEALGYMQQEQFDVILLDLSMPDSQGLEAITAVSQKMFSIPIVVLTGINDETLGLEAVRRGAQDYLIKGQMNEDLLLRVMLYAMERHRLQKIKDDFVAAVSHELRTPLTIVRDGIAQVLEGMLGATTEKQRQCLSIALSSADRLSRIINNLLDIAKIEAEKIELKKEPVNIVDLAKEVILIFKDRAQSKGLKIREDFPKEVLEVYVDKDKIIQVWTNLIGNAIKFTPQGFIVVSVARKEDMVECSVVDTGCGIVQEDLSKVFDKFQQFGRTLGPGEKGTGLGLAISKGFIELHQGRIWVESPPAHEVQRSMSQFLGEGAFQGEFKTRFVFTLPCYNARKILKEIITIGLKESIKQEASLSVLMFKIENFEAFARVIGKGKVSSLVSSLEKMTKQSLRRQSDTVIQDISSIMVILPFTKKQDASRIAGRIQQVFQSYLASQQLDSQIRIIWHIASYPEDGSDEEELLKKLI